MKDPTNPLAYRTPQRRVAHQSHDARMSTVANDLLFRSYMKGRRDREEGKPSPDLMPTWTAEECEASYRGFEEAAWSGE